MIQINDIKVLLDEDKDEIIQKIIKQLIGHTLNFTIVKESIDARKGISFIYTVNVDTNIIPKFNNKIKYKIIEKTKAPRVIKGNIKLSTRPIIIGFGPAGMFAALQLATYGYKPIIFERGEDVETRRNTVEEFWEYGKLNPESNVQFGEGGAGTFSDGKLTTRIKDPRVHLILENLVQYGAPDDILYSNKPHVGTDILVDVVKNIRTKIIELGGSVHFNSKLVELEIYNNRLNKIKVDNQWYETEVLILAVGHSARDTYRMLHAAKVDLLPKPFAVGFRIEHPQIMIDKAQFKEYYDHPKLKSAEYHLTHTTSNGRACYTFCMCPGGRVIASSSDIEQVVVNGMSYHARNLSNANSAILCSVSPEDFGDRILEGLDFQENIERKAFIMGGSNYSAPIQRVGDFLCKKNSNSLGDVTPSYKPDYQFARLDTIYPDFVYETISEGIKAFGKKLKNFDLKDAILTGVETRTSSPLRIQRNTALESTNVSGLYPCGEGAGYAGGIVSAAVDGIKAADSIITKYYL